ncbi:MULTISPECIES: hypothetical protein [Streptomyces]|uniref:Beta-ketoacyl synthase C-terminal domain-containing protein n=1 Tax=Streptomyces ehimensis TaxID=68195 RepID=A0ABV9BUY3_9ACTN
MVNVPEPGGGHEIDVIAGDPRPVRTDTVLGSSFGIGGQNAVLLLTAA